MLASPWVILAAVLALAGIGGGAYFKGRQDGSNGVIARQVRDEKIRRDTEEAAMLGTANALANIKITQTTINRKVETITRDREVYVQCINADDVVGLLDAARQGSSRPADDRKLPSTGASSP